MAADRDRQPALSRLAHDPASQRREDPVWLAAAWERALVLVLRPDLTVGVDDTVDGPRLRLVTASEAPAAASRIFLGEHAGSPLFAVTVTDSDDENSRDDQRPAVVADEVRWAGLREIGADLDGLGAGLLTVAVALTQWHSRHPRCPQCGEPTVVDRAGWARRCRNDGSEHFPRVDPAVIMLVHDGGDRCVLGRQASWPAGRYSILAGFVEPGESAEAAVAREVAEESGLTVTDVRYVASQPWPFPSSLMFGFQARVTGDPTIHVDGKELEDARWFTRDQIRRRDGLGALPPPVSIAHRIITDWLAAG